MRIGTEEIVYESDAVRGQYVSLGNVVHAITCPFYYVNILACLSSHLIKGTPGIPTTGNKTSVAHIQARKTKSFGCIR